MFKLIIENDRYKSVNNHTQLRIMLLITSLI